MKKIQPLLVLSYLILFGDDSQTCCRAFSVQNARSKSLALAAIVRPRRRHIGGISDSFSSKNKVRTPTSLADLKALDATTAFVWLATCMLMSLLLITWEDLTCQLALPSHAQRAMTVRLLQQDGESKWGQSTVQTMAFGKADRELRAKDAAVDRKASLDDEDTTIALRLRSYNEILREHFEDRIPRWQTLYRSNHVVDDHALQRATHTVCECLRQVWACREFAASYQWDRIDHALHSEPLTVLEPASSQLRSARLANTEIGFDWRSCAWRHNACGALADAQEALDELDHLLRVLEPQEAIFCLDIVERSIRDIIAAMDSSPLLRSVISREDDAFLQSLPEYVPLHDPTVKSMRTVVAETTSTSPTFGLEQQDEIDDMSGLDEAYLTTLQELSID